MDNRLVFLPSRDERHLHAYSADALNTTFDITIANPSSYPKLFCRASDLAGLPIDQSLNAITKLMWITFPLRQEEIER